MPPTFAQFGALSDAEQLDAIQRGLPAQFLDEAISRVKLDEHELLSILGIAIEHEGRLGTVRSPFSVPDSERLARLAQLWCEAYVLYETDEGVRAWLTSAVPSVGGIPIRLLATHDGFERAQRTLRQLAYGVLA